MSEQPSLESAAADFTVPRYSSLFTRQTAFVAVMILLTGGGLTVAGYGFARMMLTEQIQLRLHQKALERRSALLAYVGRQQERTRMISSNTQLLAMLDLYSDGLMSEEDFQSQSRAVLEDMRRITEPDSTHHVRDAGRLLAIRLVDLEANVVVDSGGAVHQVPMRDMPEFNTDRHQFVVGVPWNHRDQYRVQIAAPVATRAQRLFVALIEADAGPLMGLLTDRSGLGLTGEFVVGRVIDGQLQLMNPLQDAQLNDRDITHFPYLDTAVAGKMDYGPSVDRRGQDVLAACVPLEFGGWGLAAKIDYSEAYEPLTPLATMLFGLAAGTLLAGILLAYVFTFRITRPLMQLVRFSTNLARGQLYERCPIDRHNEIGVLAQSLNRMAEELQQSYTTLEQRVERRAAQLIVANRKLTHEAEVRRATERALDQERFLLLTLLETLPDNIYFKDRQSRFIRIGRAMAQRFGLSNPAEAIDRTDKDFFTQPHAEQARRDEEALMQSGEPILELEEQETWPDGHITWVASTKMPLRNEKGEIVGTFGISRDITQRRQAELALVEAKEAADAANRAKSEFVANMSHEIRTPLNGIIGMTELALDTDLTAEQRDYLETVAQSAEALLLIVNDILDFSKIEAGKLELEVMEFQLHDTLDNTLHTLALRAHKKGLELAYDVASDVPSCLIGDPARFRQIITNLVGNSIKFTHQGEVVVRVRVQQLRDDKVQLLVEVSDTGIGIPQDKQQAIFDAFTQADASTTRKFGGTGLGLTISAYLVQRMNGEIWVESEEGTGTAFFFTAEFGWKLERSPEPPPVSLHRLRNTRVLIVDDNHTNLRILHEMLESWGMLPTSLSSSREALETLERACRESDPYPVLLTDHHMPEMDGFELVASLRAQPALQDTIVLMLTSGMKPEDAERAKSLGIAVHLLKPVRQSRLLRYLEAALGGENIDRSEEFASAVPTRHLPPLHVLVAEDGLVNQKLVRELLRRLGHRVTIVTNGQDAVETYLAEPIDIVLMDVQMPGMDGIEATVQIRRHEEESGRHVSIVAMTAHAMKGDRERCLEAGMDEYVSKPLRANQLLEAMTTALSRGAITHRLAGEPGLAPPMAPAATATVDWADALVAVNGDRETLQSVVEAHLEEAPKLLAQMQLAMPQQDASGLQRASHTLKSSLRFFGAVEAAELAWKLELQAKEGSFDNVPAMITQLTQLVEQINQVLAQGVPEDA